LATKKAAKRGRGRPRKNSNQKPSLQSGPVKPIAAPGVKPLPEPIPIDGMSDDPFQLSQQFNNLPSDQGSSLGSGASSTSEPQPGEPLSAESERILGDLPDRIGDGEPAVRVDINDTDEPSPEGFAATPGTVAIVVKEKYVRLAFEAAYKALAKFFDSEHWLLDSDEARALAEPSSLLLARLLPLWFTRWAESTPGALDLLFAMAIINGPRIAEQVELSRERRGRPRPQRDNPTKSNTDAPAAVSEMRGPRRADGRPMVGAIDTAEETEG